MIVGVCRLVLALPGVTTLKEKRSIVKSLIGRIQHRFHAAVAEVEALDSHRTAVVGFAVVSNDTRHANSMVDAIVAFASGAGEALVVDRSMEILHIDRPLGGLDRGPDPAYEDDDDGGR